MLHEYYTPEKKPLHVTGILNNPLQIYFMSQEYLNSREYLFHVAGILNNPENLLHVSGIFSPKTKETNLLLVVNNNKKLPRTLQFCQYQLAWAAFSLCRADYLLVYLPACPSLCLSVCLPGCRSVHLTTCPLLLYLPVLSALSLLSIT